MNALGGSFPSKVGLVVVGIVNRQRQMRGSFRRIVANPSPQSKRLGRACGIGHHNIYKVHTLLCCHRHFDRRARLRRLCGNLLAVERYFIRQFAGKGCAVDCRGGHCEGYRSLQCCACKVELRIGRLRRSTGSRDVGNIQTGKLLGIGEMSQNVGTSRFHIDGAEHRDARLVARGPVHHVGRAVERGALQVVANLNAGFADKGFLTRFLVNTVKAAVLIFNGVDGTVGTRCNSDIHVAGTDNVFNAIAVLNGGKVVSRSRGVVEATVNLSRHLVIIGIGSHQA